MQLRQLSILGVGLLGGSIGLAIRSVAPDCRVIGYGHRQASLDRALEMGAIDAGHVDAAAAVAGSELVILCTPVGTFGKIIDEIAAALADRCVVTDVGSTKRSVVRLAEARLPAAVDFLGSHPMAGSEKRGVEYARADLFHHNLCLLTPTPGTRPAALKRVDEFWRCLGMTTARLTPQEHDRLLAQISHLPHVLAAALVAMQDDAALKLCGRGFLDTTRIAGGDGALWRDILIDNADNLHAAIESLQAQLDSVRAMLKSTAAEDLRQWLDGAAQRRAELLKAKLREMNPD